MTLVKIYVVKWCDNRVSKAGRYTHRQTDTHTHAHTHTENITGGVNRSISESYLGRGISCSVLADKEIFEFFLKAEMLQDLSDSSIEFQVRHSSIEFQLRH